MTEPTETPGIPGSEIHDTPELSGTPSKATGIAGGIESDMADIANKAKLLHDAKAAAHDGSKRPWWKFWER